MYNAYNVWDYEIMSHILQILVEILQFYTFVNIYMYIVYCIPIIGILSNILYNWSFRFLLNLDQL